MKTFSIRKCMVKEWKSLNIISTEGSFLTFYLDQAFSRISGRRILLSSGYTVIDNTALAPGKYEKEYNWKRTKYPVFFGNRNTLNWKTKHPQLRWKGLQPTKMGQLIWSWEFTLPLGTLTHGGAFGIKSLSRGGESMVEFYIFSPLHWEILRCCGVRQSFTRYLLNP